MRLTPQHLLIAACACVVTLTWSGVASAQYPYPPYGRYVYSNAMTAAVRIQATPKTAAVYVDGYRAGIVDDFDGVFQRLYVPPGAHELTLYLAGFHTVTQQVYLNPGNTTKIQITMQPLAPGETLEPPPVPQAPAAPPVGAPGQMRMMAPVPLPQNELPPPPPDQAPPSGAQTQLPPPPPPPTDPAAYGTLTLRIQPDATLVLIDGERWPTPGSGVLLVRLGEGSHHIQIDRPGFAAFSTDVKITRGETTPLTVKLVR